MKTYCRRYRIGEEQVRAAYEDWLSHESGRKNRWRVAREHGSADALVAEIAGEVRGRSLRLQPMRSYLHVDGPSGKVRTITVESCKQQVCDYAAVRALQPMLDARLGSWQYGSPHVRSNYDLARAVKRWQRDSSWWVHLDVAKCYQSTSTEMLLGMLGRYVGGSDVPYLLGELLSMHGEALALGSYLSLKLAQWLLSFGYHHVESLHKGRRGRAVALVGHQCWYMDDAWLMGKRKRDVQAAARSLGRFLAGYGLSLHPWQVCRVGDDEPMDVAGLVVRPGRVTLRDTSFLRADRALRRWRRERSPDRARSLVSHKGQLLKTDSLGYRDGHGVDEAMSEAQAVISKEARA